MRRRLLVLLGVGLASVPAGAASAAMVPNAITGVTGFAHANGDTAAGDGSISRAVDGNGLTPATPSSASTHDTTWQNGWQGAGTSGWFVLDMQTARTNLSELLIWNVKEGLGGAATGAVGRGANAVEIFHATAPTVAPVTGSAYNFGSGGWTSLTGPTTIPMSTTQGVDKVVSLASVASARYVGIRVDSNYGSTVNRIGFAEIEVTAVPEPAALGLLALGSVSLLGRRRREGFKSF